MPSIGSHHQTNTIPEQNASAAEDYKQGINFDETEITTKNQVVFIKLPINASAAVQT